MAPVVNHLQVVNVHAVVSIQMCTVDQSEYCRDLQFSFR
jgi:hypothetical protein